MAKETAVDELDNRSDDLTTFETKLVNLLALLLVQERKQTEQIDLLNRAGFRPVDIASLLGTTRNTVSVELSNRKREKKRTKGGKPK
jgi:CRP-like cAMP-binding protein